MNIALVLSGGMGARLGADIPKQYIEVAGKPIIVYCVEMLSAHVSIDGIWIVAAPIWQDKLAECLKAFGVDKKLLGFSVPGENRQLSILHGLEDIRSCIQDEAWVLIHDAARPLLSPKLVTECLNAVVGHDGVLPVLPMKDTVYVSKDGRGVTALLKRSEIYAGQAPELFHLEKYYAANLRLLPDAIREINGSTEPAIMAGMDITMIPGDENNFKITTQEDLERFRDILERR